MPCFSALSHAVGTNPGRKRAGQKRGEVLLPTASAGGVPTVSDLMLAATSKSFNGVAKPFDAGAFNPAPDVESTFLEPIVPGTGEWSPYGKGTRGGRQASKQQILKLFKAQQAEAKEKRLAFMKACYSKVPYKVMKTELDLKAQRSTLRMVKAQNLIARTRSGPINGEDVTGSSQPIAEEDEPAPAAE